MAAQAPWATPMAAAPLALNLITPVWSSQKARTPVVWYVLGVAFTSKPLRMPLASGNVPAALNV